MSKTIAAVLLAAILAGGMASPAAARPYGYHHHHHWGHWHHWRGHHGWHHGRHWRR